MNLADVRSVKWKGLKATDFSPDTKIALCVISATSPLISVWFTVEGKGDYKKCRYSLWVRLSNGKRYQILFIPGSTSENDIISILGERFVEKRFGLIWPATISRLRKIAQDVSASLLLELERRGVPAEILDQMKQSWFRK